MTTTAEFDPEASRVHNNIRHGRQAVELMARNLEDLLAASRRHEAVLREAKALLAKMGRDGPQPVFLRQDFDCLRAAVAEAADVWPAGEK